MTDGTVCTLPAACLQLRINTSAMHHPPALRVHEPLSRVSGILLSNQAHSHDMLGADPAGMPQ